MTIVHTRAPKRRRKAVRIVTAKKPEARRPEPERFDRRSTPRSERGFIRTCGRCCMPDLRSLGEIAARTSMLAVACTRCERRGRYQLDNLIAQYGANAGARVIVPAPTARSVTVQR